MQKKSVFTLACLTFYLTSCSTIYYSTWEKLGKEKRDLLKDRVTATRSEQQETKKEFQDALTTLRVTYTAVHTPLATKYDSLKSRYDDCESQSGDLKSRIESMDQIAKDLFKEWRSEANSIANSGLKYDSLAKLKSTQEKYEHMHEALNDSYANLQPVLTQFRDHVLYLKHNLNAQALGSLKDEAKSIESGIENLSHQMQTSIAETDQFLKEFQAHG